MTAQKGKLQFQAKPIRPKQANGASTWAFVILPKELSAQLPRRGRLSVSVALNGYAFDALLEPDGQKSHWLRLDSELLEHAGAAINCVATIELTELDQEPEPEVPGDLALALKAAPNSQATWDATTTIARLDWIHWIESAKQPKTRAKRINDACDMLASGKKRVCCFDSSGFYSKALRAPEAAEPMP